MFNKNRHFTTSAFLLSLLLSVFQTAQATDFPTRTFCVFDPIGEKGPAYQGMLDYKAAALEWGVILKLQAYTSEAVALADFKAGLCDAVGLTGTRIRPFNKFTATIEAVGAIDTYEQMRKLVGMLAHPKAKKYMIEGDYEVAGIMPAGTVFIFVRDRTINSVEAAAGKRLATLDYDAASVKVVKHIGATMVPVNIATFAPRFNNGFVDIAYAPAIAYEPFEMYKGMGDTGGILRFNFAQMNGQLILRKDKFPEGFGQSSRDYAFSNFPLALEHIVAAEKGIPEKYWIDLPAEKHTEYKEMLRQVRLELRDEGVYDKRMLKILFKLRCKTNPSHYECAERLES
jgi:TRAP-type C4-dicarboxylate transport system substrate-binding protein